MKNDYDDNGNATSLKTETIRADFNGRRCEFSAAAADNGNGGKLSVLQAARAAGLEIPTLCDDERLRPAGACRLCLVEIRGFTHPVVSCTTALTDGMEIETHTPALERARAANLKMLARKYPVAAFREFPEKPFHRLAREYELSENDFLADGGEAPAEMPPPPSLASQQQPQTRLVDDSHPYIHVDMTRCVECYRCVRICDEVQGQFVWQVFGRGDGTRIVPDSDTLRLRESSCVACGACVDTCPSGALEDRSVLERGAPTAWTKTVCPYCGTGCEMHVGTRGGKIVQVKPTLDAPVSRGHLCVKGRYAFDFTHADDRVTKPMIREENGGGRWRTVSWPEAIAYTAEKLKRIVAASGAESIGVLGSARATNEENYLAQKFARVALGTNNVDNCARVCHTPTAAAMKMMLGTGAATNSFDDIELARTILICGANPTDNHPVPAARIKQAVRRGGARLIIIDPRKTELTEYAEIHLQLRPGTNVPLLNSMAAVIVEENLFDESFIENRVAEFEEFRQFVRPYAPEKVAEICGVEADLIRRAARLYATEKPAMSLHGLGVTEHTQGTEGVMCVVNLALLTGNMGRRGAGVNPLRGQNNVQGAAQMGCDPGILTGSIAVDEGRAHFESVWRAPVPTRKGLNLLQMTDAAKSGKLKALWAIGYDVFLTLANAHETAKSFGALELVVVQDLFLNETARAFGHVFFPAASSFEKDGTFMNAERRVQRVRKAVEPPGEARADWQIIRDLAQALGKGEFFRFDSAEEIWNEIRAVWPNAAGISYERIEKSGLQWNCPDLDHPGTEFLHAESFAHGPRAALRRIEFRPTRETVSEEFPLLLTTGRALYQFNAGTMTARTPNSDLRPTDLLVVAPPDAARLGIENGERVRVRSAYGEVVLPAVISSTVKKGELFATFHAPQVFMNRLTSPRRDRFVLAPEYKVTAVRVEKLDESARFPVSADSAIQV